MLLYQHIEKLMMDKNDFKTRLKIAKKEVDQKSNNNDNKKGLFMGSAFRLGTELVAAVIVGSTIGFLLDGWFDTKPLLTICFFFMGVAAGISNVFKSAKKMNKKL